MQELIREKNRLRQYYKSLRLGISPQIKAEADNGIFLSAVQFLKDTAPSQVLCYVSSPPVEADTRQLLSYLLDCGTETAVPLCIKGTNDMVFYRITSMSQLKKGYFGIEEPDAVSCIPVEICEDSVCFVPGLAFDEGHYRIGFGKGFYDKFLASYRGISAGICPEYCLERSLPHEIHDMAVDYVITDKKIMYKYNKHGEV